jgi:hypothetical protein
MNRVYRFAKCGEPITGGVAFCGKCGEKVVAYQSDVSVKGVNEMNNTNYNQQGNPQGGNPTNDRPSMGYAVLGFFFPVVGLILWLIWKDPKPLTAKSAGKGALIGVILQVVGWIIYAIWMASLYSSLSSLY